MPNSLLLFIRWSSLCNLNGMYGKCGPFYGFKIRLTAALRCLSYKHFILVAWTREEDGDLNFRICHKGVELTEAVHRLGVDAVEILQDINDQNLAIDEANEILK